VGGKPYLFGGRDVTDTLVGDVDEGRGKLTSTIRG
jgi:hypothetical protein